MQQTFRERLERPTNVLRTSSLGCILNKRWVTQILIDFMILFWNIYTRFIQRLGNTAYHGTMGLEYYWFFCVFLNTPLLKTIDT